jgi:protein-tyrosine-phosphatase
MIDSADKIFIMCKKEECPQFLLDSNKINFWDIDDPNNTNIDNHKRIRDEIKEKVRELVLVLEID